MLVLVNGRQLSFSTRLELNQFIELNDSTDNKLSIRVIDETPIKTSSTYRRGYNVWMNESLKISGKRIDWSEE